MPSRPRVVAFDVVQTLMSLESMRLRLSEAGLPGSTLERWFDRILRDGMALTLAGDYAPFPVLAASGLRTLASGDMSDEAVDHVMAGFAELREQSDAEPAIRMLAGAGISVVCLTNGPAESTQNFLKRTTLDRYVDDVISVEDVRMWKPAGNVYAYALRRLGRPAEEVAMVAVHAWDCHGAQRAGFTTGWAGRLESHFPEIFERPDVMGDDLIEVARGLLALPEP